MDRNFRKDFEEADTEDGFLFYKMTEDLLDELDKVRKERDELMNQLEGCENALEG